MTVWCENCGEGRATGEAGGMFLCTFCLADCADVIEDVIVQNKRERTIRLHSYNQAIKPSRSEARLKLVRRRGKADAGATLSRTAPPVA
jgi:hypothetical protein